MEETNQKTEFGFLLFINSSSSVLKEHSQARPRKTITEGIRGPSASNGLILTLHKSSTPLSRPQFSLKLPSETLPTQWGLGSLTNYLSRPSQTAYPLTYPS